jgi:putative membrane protein
MQSETSLDLPGRVSAKRLHPLSPFVGMILALRQIAVGVAWIVINSWWWLILPLLALVPLWAFVSWLRTTYEIGDQGITLRSGILWRQVKSAAPDRLQQVDVTRKLRHQVFGLSLVTVEFAGDKIHLEALGAAEAQRVRDTLEAMRRGQSAVSPDAAAAPPPPPPPAADVVRLSPRLLALGGVTGAGLVTVPAALYALMSQADEVGALADLRDRAIDSGAALGAAATGALGVFGVALVLATSALVFVVRFHGYRLSRRSGDLLVSHGLLDQRTTVVPLARVQATNLHQSIVRRRLGLASLGVTTAAAVNREGAGTAGQLVPVAHWGDVLRVEQLVFGRDRPEAVAHPPAARRRAIMRRWWALALLVTPLWRVSAIAALTGYVAAPALAALWGRSWYARLRSGLDDWAVVAEDGVLFWNRRTAPLAKVQSVRTSASLMQRRSGLVTAYADIAGGRSLVIRDIASASPLITQLRRVALGGVVRAE